MAAEYVLKEGNEDVILCERGIRTFETATRFTLDIMAIPVLKQMSHLPVVVDPSHAAGRRDLVLPLSLGGGRGGRRRDHRRGPPRSRGGDLRRTAGGPGGRVRAPTWSRFSGWRRSSGTSCRHTEDTGRPHDPDRRPRRRA